MSLLAMLVGGLRVLLRAAGVFLAFGMIALAMLFGGGSVGFGGVVVMFGGFVVLVSSHLMGLVFVSAPSLHQITASRIVPQQLQSPTWSRSRP
jgi:hypothetical protein